MDVTPLIARNLNVIQSHRNEFKISGKVYKTSIIIMPECVLEWPYAGRLEDLTIKAFRVLDPFAEEVEMILLGAFSHTAPLPYSLHQSIKRQLGATIELMEMGAACRTYNVLLAEGRKIAAALLYNPA